MRILVFNWRDPEHPEAGGAEEYVHECMSAWAASGHEVALITANPLPAPREVLNSPDGPVVRVGSRYRYYLEAQREYKAHWVGWADAVLESVNGVPLFTPLYVEEPIVALFHHIVGGIFFREVPAPLAAVGYMLERVSPAIYHHVTPVAVSPSTCEDLVRRGVPRERIHVIPNGVGFSDRGASIERSGNSVLYLGRLKRYKRLDLLVDAARRVIRDIPDAEFLIAGRGDYAQTMRSLVDARGLTPNFRFLGFVSEESKEQLLRRCKLVVSTSEKEGWGIVLLEAASRGVPAVAFDAPGIRDAVVDGQTGLLVPRHRPDALARALVFLLRDEQARARLALGASVRARNFRWDITASRLLSVLMAADRDQRSRPN